MDDARLIGTALRCYPARWRRRHGDEAAELAALLIADGSSPSSIALSYLAGAAREWLVPRPSRRLSTVACALLVVVSSLGLSAELVASAAPARAASQTAPASQTSAPANEHCLPAPVTPATSQLVTIWEGRHDRTC
jgi:hypothetical protein